jgi:hypothetical protein
MNWLFAVSLVVLGADVPPVAVPFQWGVNGHAVSQVGYFDVPMTTQLDMVSELGAGWYRMDWGVEAFQGNTARLDKFLAEASKRRIRLLPVLFASPGSQSKDETAEQVRVAAATYAKAVVSRYRGKITHWELSNELDAYAMIRKGEKARSGKVWIFDGAPDGSSPEHYEDSRYQRAKAEIQGLQEGVKAADSNARTIVNTAGWLHYGFVERLVREDRVPFDILAWHWYSEMGDLTKVQGKLNLIELLQGFGKPLWITEINRQDGSKGGKEHEQSEYVRKVANQLQATPGIEALFFYELLDQPYFGEDNPESYYGLVEVVRGSDNKWRVKRKKEAFAAAKAGMTGK